jgi:hypothetical protein
VLLPFCSNSLLCFVAFLFFNYLAGFIYIFKGKAGREKRFSKDG